MLALPTVEDEAAAKNGLCEKLPCEGLAKPQGVWIFPEATLVDICGLACFRFGYPFEMGWPRILKEEENPVP